MHGKKPAGLVDDQLPASSLSGRRFAFPRSTRRFLFRFNLHAKRFDLLVFKRLSQDKRTMGLVKVPIRAVLL